MAPGGGGAATGGDIFSRKAFTWTKIEAAELPPENKRPELQSGCSSCGRAFVSTETFCSRCGAPREAVVREAPALRRPPPAAEAAADAAQESGLWRYSPPESKPMAVRKDPRFDSHKTSELLQPGDVFRVAEEQRGADGVLFLRLADGRGWVMEGMPSVGALCVRQEGEAQQKAQAAAAAAAAGGALQKGMWVRTTGLLSRPEMNGKSGILKGFDTAKGRWKVSFEDGSGTKLLRDENIEPLDAAAKDEGTGDKQAVPAESGEQAEQKTDPFSITVCVCGSNLLPHATFCGRCGTLREDLPALLKVDAEASPQAAPPVKLETKEQFNRRIEEMLASGEIEWEDW